MRTLEGMWVGHAHQPSGPRGMPIDLPLNVIFSLINGRCDGEATYEFEGVFSTLKLSSRSLKSRYIVWNFYDTDERVIRFGTFLLQLSADGKRLEGKFLGYAAEMEDIVTGSIKLTKA